MSFHRGGIVGVFDQLSSYLHERAKRERFELKQAKKRAQIGEPVRLTDPILTERPLNGGERAVTVMSGHETPASDPVAALQASTSEFGDAMDELTRELGGRLPGEPVAGFKPTGEGMPGLPNGATMSSASPIKKIGDREAIHRIRTSLGQLSNVPWLIECSGDIIIIRAPKDRAGCVREDALALSSAIGAQFELPELIVLPSRRTFIVEQIETRAHLLKLSREKQEVGPNPDPQAEEEAPAKEPSPEPQTFESS